MIQTRNLLVLAFAVVTVGANASVIDQDAFTNNVWMAGFGQGDLAQSFKQAAGNIDGAGIFLQTGIGTSDTVTIELWDNLPNASGNLLASASAVGTNGSYVDVFWPTVSITPETTYYLVFTGNTTLGISGDVTNQYSRGQVYANAGFGSFPDFDYTFRTWAAVPEPFSMVAMGAGLLGLAARRRRSK